MTRRLTALLMALLLALAGGGAAYAESTEILQVLYTGELNHNTNVRESPSSSAKRLGSLKEGDAIEILEIGDDWFTILWEGEAAYVTAGNVDKVQADPASWCRTSTTMRSSSRYTQPRSRAICPCARRPRAIRR